MIVSCGWADYSSFYAIISALFWVFLSYWWFLSFFAKWKIFFFTALAPTIIYLQTRGDFFSLMFLSWLNFITLFNPYLGGLNGCFSLKYSMYLIKMFSIDAESSLGMSYLYYCLSIHAVIEGIIENCLVNFLWAFIVVWVFVGVILGSLMLGLAAGFWWFLLIEAKHLLEEEMNIFCKRNKSILSIYSFSFLLLLSS